MIVALTSRHFRDLVSVTDTAEAISALESALDVDFSSESDRFTHRGVITALFATWFRKHTADQVSAALARTSVLHERYRDFGETVASTDVQDNPLFASLEQPRIGTYLAAGAPAAFDGHRFHVGPASALGADTESVVAELLDEATSTW